MLSGKTISSSVKKMKSELTNTQGKESNTITYIKLVVQKKEAKHFIGRD